MKRTDKLIAEIQGILLEVEDDVMSVPEYASLFAKITAGADFDAPDGLNRLSWVMHDHGKNIRAAHERLGEIVRKLASP